jgi:hypothetical protein
MAKRRPVLGTIHGVQVRSKMVSDALTQAQDAIANLQEVNRRLGESLSREQEVGRILAEKLRVYRSAGWYWRLAYLLGMVEMP